jgi:hypothetical protein
MLSIPSLRWLKFLLSLTGLGSQSVHFLRAKLFIIQIPLPRVLAVLGVELIDRLVHLPDALGPQRFPEQIELGISFPAQIREHDAGHAVAHRGAINLIEVLVNHPDNGTGHISETGEDNVIAGMTVVLSAQEKEDAARFEFVAPRFYAGVLRVLRELGQN